MPAPGKGPGSASGTGGPGSLGGSGRGSPGGFGGKNGGTKGLTDREKALINMGKAVPKKTKQFEMSVENIGTLISNLQDVTNPIGAMAKAGLGQLGVPGFDPEPLSSFEGQLPDVTRAEGVGSQRGEGEELNLLQPLVKKKKQQTKLPGFQLLEGAGGSLLGS